MEIRTRGNSDARGKQRIYLLGDEEDLRTYVFGEGPTALCNQIFQYVNCAICYAVPGEETKVFEEMLHSPSKMHMVLVIVTKRFFKNEELLHVMQEAIEQHIPILPIVEEAECENIFNRQCGNLQCLNPNLRDPSEIPFEEKLSTFLGQTLVDDNVVKQVREAFDAYIFLSYRKKDRQYIHELMKQIHANSFCRDVAIWFDEFLVPGEDFNDAIRIAIDKSKVFLLAVTPSLINEKNYVQEIEYPYANNQGKSCIAVELVETDYERLSELYPGIPACVDVKEQEDLEETLWNALKDQVKVNNKNVPSQNYYMGLAYLNGIDVEVDYTRALELLTQAADYGMPEAVEKLIFLYENGVGVARDYEEALKWQKALMDCYKRPKTALEMLQLVRTTYNYAVRLSATGKKKEAMQYFEKALKLGEDAIANQLAGEKLFDRILVDCCYQMAQTCDELGEFTEAQAYLQKAGTYHRSLSDNENEQKNADQSAKQLLQKIQIVSKDGDLAIQQGQYEKAYEQYVQAYHLADELEKKTDVEDEQEQVTCRNAKVVVCMQLARVAKPKQAIAYYEEALALLDTLLAAFPDDMALKKNRYACHINTCDVLEYEEEYEQAQVYAKKALEFATEIAQQSETVDSLLDLLTVWVRYGEICYHLECGFLQLAPILAKATEVADQLEGKTDAVVYYRAVHGIKRLYALSYAMMSDTKGLAVKFMNEAIEAAETMVSRKKSVENRECLASSYEEYIQIDDSPIRLRAMAMLIKVLLDLADDYPGNQTYLEIARSYRVQLDEQYEQTWEEMKKIVWKVQSGAYVEESEIRKTKAILSFLEELKPYIDYIHEAMC